MNEKSKRKNILDLQFQKNLIIASTSVILAFTYLIGVGIGVVTKQIKLDDFIIMGVLFTISIGVLSICGILFFNAKFHLRKIIDLVKEI